MTPKYCIGKINVDYRKKIYLTLIWVGFIGGLNYLYLKLVSIMLETWNLVGKYIRIFSSKA